MDIVAVTGGLGNQMFQYAFGMALAYQGYNVKFDITKYGYYQVHNNYELENVFGIQTEYATKSEIASLGYRKDNRLTRLVLNSPFRKKTVFCENEVIYPLCDIARDNTYYKGYWQNENYFLEIAEQVRSAYRFSPCENDKFVKIRESIIQSDCSVSIHVRRGDYVNHPLYRGLCDIDYYERAYEVMIGEVGRDAQFFVFSNDPEWVKDSLPFPNMTIVDCNTGNESYRDMQLMSYCHHNIIANSTFSWWAAWLNDNKDKKVIAPQKWLNSELDTYNQIVPKRWTKV